MNKEKLQEYFYSNVATMFWSVFLLLGGGIFVAYFAHIEYMPDFDLKSSITVTAAAAVTALIIGGSLLVMMILPGVFWGNAWGDSSSIKNYWTDNEGNRKFFGLLIWFALPLGIIYLLIAAIVKLEWMSIFLFAVVLLAYFCFFVFWSRLGFWGSLKETGALSITTVVTSIILFYPLWLVFNLAFDEEPSSTSPLGVSGVLSCLFIVFVNVMAAANPKNIKPFYWYLGLGVVTVFVVFSSFGISHRIPVRVMEIYKFGNIEASDVVLKKKCM